MTTNRTAVGLAEEIARAAHHGQTDKSGRPYIEHVQEVVGDGVYVEDEDGSHLSAIGTTAAWLHDVVEDTDWTLEALSERGREMLNGFQVIVWGRALVVVDAFTHRKGERNEDYWARIKFCGSRAVAVKKRDIASNTRPERLAKLDAKTQKRLADKYARALEAISS